MRITLYDYLASSVPSECISVLEQFDIPSTQNENELVDNLKYFVNTYGQDALDTLKSLGKTKVYPYGKGQVCFHHKGDYFFISPYSFKWSPRHRANEKWRKPKDLSIKGCFEDIDGWCEYKKRKRLEDKK